jgi:hypothetical protein
MLRLHACLALALSACQTDAPSPTAGALAADVLPRSNLRTPSGIFVHVPLADLASYAGDWSPFFGCFFGWMLDNPAVAGLELNIGWNEISHGPDPTNPAENDWTGIQAAVDAVQGWNSMHPHQPAKKIQLIVIPGFKSPTWLLDELAHKSCDSILAAGPDAVLAPYACEAVTITGYTEGEPKSTGCAQVWPLPWSTTYKTAWHAFLVELAQLYGNKPEIVSIAMGGPTGTSDEMFVPHYESSQKAPAFGAPQQTYGAYKYDLDEVIARMIANWAGVNAAANVNPYAAWLPPLPTDWKRTNDDVFFAEWLLTIDDYASIFRDLTLILTPAKGDVFPELQSKFDKPCAGSDCSTYAALCPSPSMSCATVTRILMTFMASAYGPASHWDGKAVQVSGLTKKEDTNVGIKGVRYIAQVTEDAPGSPAQVVAGAQFAHAFSGKHHGICGRADLLGNDCSVEAAEDWVFGAAFDGTAAACRFWDTDPYTKACPVPEQNGDQPLNFLQIYWEDLLYATETGECLPTASPKSASPYATPMGTVASLQDLFDAAAAILPAVASNSTLSAPACDTDLLAGTCVTAPPLAACCTALIPSPIACASDAACDAGSYCDTATGTCQLLLAQCPLPLTHTEPTPTPSAPPGG